MKIKFRTKHMNGENVIMSACPEADALFSLLKPKRTLKPEELPWVGRMGFEIEIVGDTIDLHKEISKDKLNYQIRPGVISISN